RKYNIALVLADTAGRYPYFEDITADFVYLRLHGDEEFYVSGYQPEMLKWWADRILSWSAGSEPSDALKLTDDKIKKIPRDIYIYFDNDLKVKAPHDAQVLQKFLRILPRSLDVTA
ncbi:MAG: DUF72 domain-containing protein, partial [Bdellovibrio sp.]|nr:DUF72 domain-containing protein [Bdellovibrio sp.]